jgi:hypothetical protein
MSTDGTNATNFLSAITTGSPNISKVPVDPTNKGTATPDGALAPAAANNNYEYFYYRYAAGGSGCDASRGDYYVLGIARMDTIASGQHALQSPGFACVSRDGAYEGIWATGKFTIK